MAPIPLYVLVNQCGDGSFYPSYTLNPKLIKRLQEAHDKDFMDYENGIGCDGDGFHYGIILVPHDSTPESLGIGVLPDTYADKFFEDR